MTPTASTAPWWYVAALAGIFTLLGASVSFLGTWLTARQKNRLEDYRRFEGDIIAAYIRLDDIAGILHENAGGDLDEEKAVFWKLYPEVNDIYTRLQLVANPEIYKLANSYRSTMIHMAPGTPGATDPAAPGMSEIVEILNEMRLAIRLEIRVGVPKGDLSWKDIDKLEKKYHRRETRKSWLRRSAPTKST